MFRLPRSAVALGGALALLLGGGAPAAAAPPDSYQYSTFGVNARGGTFFTGTALGTDGLPATLVTQGPTPTVSGSGRLPDQGIGFSSQTTGLAGGSPALVALSSGGRPPSAEASAARTSSAQVEGTDVAVRGATTPRGTSAAASGVGTAGQLATRSIADRLDVAAEAERRARLTTAAARLEAALVALAADPDTDAETRATALALVPRVAALPATALDAPLSAVTGLTSRLDVASTGTSVTATGTRSFERFSALGGVLEVRDFSATETSTVRSDGTRSSTATPIDLDGRVTVLGVVVPVRRTTDPGTPGRVVQTVDLASLLGVLNVPGELRDAVFGALNELDDALGNPAFSLSNVQRALLLTDSITGTPGRSVTAEGVSSSTLGITAALVGAEVVVGTRLERDAPAGTYTYRLTCVGPPFTPRPLSVTGIPGDEIATFTGGLPLGATCTVTPSGGLFNDPRVVRPAAQSFRTTVGAAPFLRFLVRLRVGLAPTPPVLPPTGLALAAGTDGVAVANAEARQIAAQFKRPAAVPTAQQRAATAACTPKPGVPVVVAPRVGRCWQVRSEGFSEAALAIGVQRFAGSAAPGSVGTFAVAGHRNVTSSKASPFRDLHLFRFNDTLAVRTVYGTTTYRVKKVSVVPKEDTSSLRASPGQRKLVLAGCAGGLARRLVVEATA